MTALSGEWQTNRMKRRSRRTQPFAEYTPAVARQYEAWYATPAGRSMVEEERALLARLLQSRSPYRSVLEVGCGTGHFTRWFADLGLTSVGADVAPGMLAVALEMGGTSGYVRARAEALPLTGGSFDLVAFITALEFIERPLPALREAARVARRGLLLGVLNLASPLGMQRTLAARVQPASPFRSARFFTPWRLEQLVRRSLGPRVRAIRWQTAIWPDWSPRQLRLRPFGAFIGMLVVLREPEEHP
jgi:ubiquinone/menaquinone biosynthesis C-methylase UbiE